MNDRPFKAIRLTSTEDWWFYSSYDEVHRESVWRCRGEARLTIRHASASGAQPYRLYRAGDLVREFDTLVAAQERGVDLETGR